MPTRISKACAAWAVMLLTSSAARAHSVHVDWQTKYCVKTIVGVIPSDGGKISDKTEFEIIPKADAGKIQFQVLASGKPLPGTTVMVMTPGKKGETEVKTGDQGWTTSFTGSGRYAATSRKSETTAGTRDGKKFEGIALTATLVVDMN